MEQIIVIMMVALGSDTDALEITHITEQPLRFETQEICYAHVYENLDKLKEFASSQFDERNSCKDNHLFQSAIWSVIVYEYTL